MAVKVDGRVVITRHLPRTFPEYAFASEQQPLEHKPRGLELTRPFPEARVFFIDIDTKSNGGWLYVYWISEHLMHPQATVEPRT